MAAPKEYDKEEMIDKVLEILAADLPAAIAEVNTEKGNFPLVEPLAYFFGMRHVDPRPEIGKSIVLAMPNEAMGDKFNPGITEEDFSIDVIIVAWEDKAEVVERKILRYAKALRRVLDNHPLTRLDPRPTNIGDSVVGYEAYNPSDFEGNIYMKSATVRMKIRDRFCYQIG